MLKQTNKQTNNKTQQGIFVKFTPRADLNVQSDHLVPMKYLDLVLTLNEMQVSL